MLGRICFFQDTLQTIPKTYHFQMNIESLIANKIFIFFIIVLFCSLRLAILLEETHRTNGEMLLLPSFELAVSSLSRKHGLATFFHERLRYMLLNQSPLISEIKWFCVDVDGYQILNVYKPSPTRLQSQDLPVFLHPCLYTGDFNGRHNDWVTMIIACTASGLAGWVNINCLALLYQGCRQLLLRSL